MSNQTSDSENCIEQETSEQPNAESRSLEERRVEALERQAAALERQNAIQAEILSVMSASNGLSSNLARIHERVDEHASQMEDRR